MAACPSCGEENPARARFCLNCGKPLVAAREMRKTVTIVFCDVVDSTPLGERFDAEAYRRVISRYFLEASNVIERHGGTIEKFIGDAVMAVFGIPVVHEDDALRAVRAATELREALGALNERLRDEFDIELGIRTGVNTGEVVAGDPTEGQAFATGEAVALAQRLESAASAGEILIGDKTHALVRDAVLVEPVDPLAVKGRAEPVTAWRLLGVVTGAPGFARRLDSPLVARERELALLEHAFRRAVDERACHLFTVFGAAGVGKSRLLNEFVDSLEGDARVLLGRCVPYGEGMTYWPLREVVRQAAAIGARTSQREAQDRFASLLSGDPDAASVAERLAAAAGLADGEASNEETQWAVRRLVERTAAEQPLVLVFDDIQWAEPAFLELVDHLADWTRNAPVLIVCLARPELLDDHPAWGGGKVNASAVLLEPLRGPDIERLIANLLRVEAVPPELARSLREAGEGNPLFIEEMLAMLVDQGRIVPEDGDWGADGGVGTIDAPPTIQALLAARLDRLERAERDAIGRAAVIGKVFSREALGALVPERDLDDCLQALVRKDLLRPDRTAPPGEEVYRFRHILIRDAAYLALPKSLRAELHEQLAEWLQEARNEREYEEVLGFHLEQAHRFREEVVSDDAHTQELGQRAARFFAASGRRALDRGDMAAGASLLTRATLLLRDDEPGLVALAPDLGFALAETGQLERAEAVLARASEGAERLGDRRLALRAEVERAMVRSRLDPAARSEELRALADEAIRVFETAGDEKGLARAWVLVAWRLWLEAQWGVRGEALERAVVHARKAGDRRLEAHALGGVVLSLVWGTTPVPEAIERCERMLEEVEGEMHLRARVLVGLADLRAQQGDFDEARRLYEETKALATEHGLTLLVALHTLTGGSIELLAGDADAAERELRWGYERLRRIGERVSLSTSAAYLAEALYRLGSLDEAERFTEIGQETAAVKDRVTHAIVRGTRAKILAARGDAAGAEPIAREAVSLTEETDDLNLRAAALLSLAEVLGEAGREDEARHAREAAVELFRRKGNAVAEAQAVAALEATR
jgi:class 3 adenylate cyclase/tetratricopeptide (TPR) repeat protein